MAKEQMKHAGMAIIIKKTEDGVPQLSDEQEQTDNPQEEGQECTCPECGCKLELKKK